MPIYEYICTSCARRFEALRPISQRALPAKCPHCGAETGELELSRSAFLGGSTSGSGGGCSTNTWTGGG